MKLKRVWCFVLGWLTCLLVLCLAKAISNDNYNWYSECDAAYGYTTNYYTCRNYHIKGSK